MINLESYTATETVHEGTHTIVYRGLRNADRHPVIIKAPRSEYPSPAENARLRHEYMLAKDLDLPGTVRPFSMEKHDNQVVLVMEDLGEQSLRDIIQSRRTDLTGALRIGVSIANILGSLHEHHIIHKDIKPTNILIDAKTQRVTLIDFGIATRLSQEPQTATSADVLEGTLAYMSPEQTGRVNRPVDRRSDLYSLGVTLYELLTGLLPFPTTDPVELVHCHVARMPAPPHEVAAVPEAVSNIVMKLLSKVADDRYQCAHGLEADLEHCLEQMEKTAPMTPFPLGREDRTGELRIPQKLYGREEQIARLLEAFDRSADGSAELLLISGAPGVGKSVLVKEVQKDIVRRQGYFIEGKFDQLHRGIPYAPITHAFRTLMKQILGEPPERLALWQQDLQSAVSSYVPFLMRLLPELELVLGPQPSLPEIGGGDAQNRFALAFQNFIRVFTTIDHPLVLFLDDLQWADPASLKLLELILSDPESAYLLVIAAYRENDADAAHPLWSVVDDVRNAGKPVTEIKVKPLEPPDVCRLIGDALGAEPGEVKSLAELAFTKTLGNPFFLHQFLRMLQDQKLLIFDTQSASFRWDLRRIRDTGVTDNVVDLMLHKLQQLAPDTQHVLRRAACIGHQFDLRTLSVIHEKSPADTAADLWEALRESLVLPLDPEYRFLQICEAEAATAPPKDTTFNVSYKFLHDRVQQAAYGLIEEADKQQAHLRVGRLMRRQSEHPQVDGALLDIVRHLNFGASLITDPSERLDLARLNLTAGRRAKASTAYEAAAEYFKAGVSLLPAASWEQEYDLTYSLHVEWGECEYLSGRLEHAEALFDLLLLRAKSTLERVYVQNLRIVRYSLMFKFVDALHTAKAALDLVGIELPDKEEAWKAAADAEFATVQRSLEGRHVAELVDLPPMTDPDKQAALEILVNLLGTAYISSPSLLVYVASKQVNLSLQYGHSNLSTFGYMNYGFILSVAMGRYAEAHDLGRLAIELHEKWPNPDAACKLYLLFACAIIYYRRPLHESLPYFKRGYDSGLASGDFVQLAYICQHQTMVRLGLGDELDAIQEQVERFIVLMKRIKDHNTVLFLIIIRQMIANLKGRTNSRDTLDDATFDEAALVAELERSGLTFTLCWYYIVKHQVLFFHEDLAGALATGYEADKRIAANLGMFSTTEFAFYFPLTLAAAYPDATVEQQRKYLEDFTTQATKLANWSENCPETFAHKHLLVQAELARIQGDHEKASDLYDRAIDTAQQNGFPHHQALASELTAKFYLARNRKKIASMYMTAAYHGYVRWGATAKADGIVKQHPSLLIRTAPVPLASSTISTSRRVPAELLEMATMFRAAHAISSEIVFEEVLDRWMRIVIENAGAQKGALILRRDDRLLVEASITVDPDTIQLGLGVPVENAPDVAVSVVRYVARTRQALILNDPAREARFALDPYIARHHPKSILCLAMTHQGRLTGILYLENNINVEAFPPSRLEMLGLLASQAAVAMENALLYERIQSVTGQLRHANETLEHEVEQRTNDLRSTTEELRQTNERLQVEFAERARAEQAHMALQQEIIHVQNERLAELSSPLIPISDQVMVMPLIGTMDEARAQQVFETALQGVLARHTHVVIIDITGVKRIDEAVASTLVRMAKGVRLLGAQVILTGIRPSVATTLVELGVDLQSIITRSTLQSAIAYAMGRSHRAS